MSERDDPYRRRRFVIEANVHDDDFEQLADALLAVADLLDPGQVDMSAGPASETERGKADWIYAADLDTHIPSCSQPKGAWRCGNGPLIGRAIQTGDCGEHES